jgi:4-amino-4-deoxy-L-arabinose transferase-like glycosyltransferase
VEGELSPGKRFIALGAIAILAGLSYAWAAGQDMLEFYYEAAVRSMALNWHNFIFGAMDPAGTITLDKLPGAFWVQALSVKVFGFNTWAMVLPQAVEGILTVFVLYRAVSRLAGHTAGLVAALILAASPATVALNRGNISDSLMILLLVLAADAVSAAVQDRRPALHLVLAAFWVGLAFQTKMIEAWMVLPAFALVYLVDGPAPLARKLRQLLVAGVVVAVISLSWISAVSLVPSGSRPYADGSTNDSLYAQVFVYNGFGRFGDQTPTLILRTELAPDSTIPAAPPPAAGRLFSGDLGRDTGWLLPAALAAGLAGVIGLRRRPRGDPLRACFVLWGSWLLTLAVVFSVITTLQTYYTAALAPAIGALIGVAITRARPHPVVTAAVAVVTAGTVAYAAWLIPDNGAHLPGWLRLAVICVGAVATAGVLATLTYKRAWPLALAGALAAVLLAPVVADVTLVANHESAFDTPFEQPKLAVLLASVPRQLDQLAAVTVPKLRQIQDGAPDLQAAQTGYLASLYIDASGDEVLPIGGFDGTTPSPTLAQLRSDVANGVFHLIIVATTADPRMAWIAAHCRQLSAHLYLCTPQDVTNPQGPVARSAPAPAPSSSAGLRVVHRAVGAQLPERVLALDAPDGARTRSHHQRVRARPAAGVPDAREQFAVGDPGRREEHVV